MNNLGLFEGLWQEQPGALPTVTVSFDALEACDTVEGLFDFV